MKCDFCGEEVEPEEAERVIACLKNGSAHSDCLMRSVVGSVGHQNKQCSCFGLVDVSEPEGLSRRQCARNAAEEFRRQMKAAGISHYFV